MDPLAPPPLSWPVGHLAVRQRLQHQLQTGQIPHAQLFAGREGIGKRSYARAFARHLLDPSGKGGIADFIEFAPEGKLEKYTVGMLHHLREQAMLTPMAGSYKVYLLDDVERMTPPAAASLLKTLEEPPNQTVFLLMTSSPREVLSTIVSRCHVVLFDPLSDEEVAEVLKIHGWAAEPAQAAARRAQGSVQAALRRVRHATHPQVQALNQMLQQLHDCPVASMSQAFYPLDQERQKLEQDVHELRELFFDMVALIEEWARDLQCLRLQRTEGLCNPEHEALLREQLQRGVASWRDVEKSVHTSIEAFDRLVKPSVILTGLLLRLRAV